VQPLFYTCQVNFTVNFATQKWFSPHWRVHDFVTVTWPQPFPSSTSTKNSNKILQFLTARPDNIHSIVIHTIKNQLFLIAASNTNVSYTPEVWKHSSQNKFNITITNRSRWVKTAKHTLLTNNFYHNCQAKHLKQFRFRGPYEFGQWDLTSSKVQRDKLKNTNTKVAISQQNNRHYIDSVAKH